MKLHNVTEINAFVDAVDRCDREIWLTSPAGDSLNLKSKLSQYLGISKLIGTESDMFEITAATKADEAKMLQFFRSHPEIREAV